MNWEFVEWVVQMLIAGLIGTIIGGYVYNRGTCTRGNCSGYLDDGTCCREDKGVTT